MKILATLRAHEIYPDRPAVADDSYGLMRDSVRIMVIDGDGRVALNHYPERGEKKGGYMIPGGGVDVGETILTAAEREVSEELGCKIKNIKVIGVVLEYGVGKKVIHAQKEHIYTAEIDGEPGDLKPTEEELADGLEIKWLNPEKAIKEFDIQSASFSRTLALIALSELKKIV